MKLSFTWQNLVYFPIFFSTFFVLEIIKCFLQAFEGTCGVNHRPRSTNRSIRGGSRCSGRRWSTCLTTPLVTGTTRSTATSRRAPRSSSSSARRSKRRRRSTASSSFVTSHKPRNDARERRLKDGDGWETWNRSIKCRKCFYWRRFSTEEDKAVRVSIMTHSFCDVTVKIERRDQSKRRQSTSGPDARAETGKSHFLSNKFLDGVTFSRGNPF